MSGNAALYAVLGVIAVGVVLLIAGTLRRRYHLRRHREERDAGFARLEEARSLEGEAWIEAQDAAVHHLHEALRHALPEQRAEAELEMHRARVVYEQRYVAAKLAQARAALDAAAHGATEARRERAEAALHLLHEAERQNHRPPEIKAMRKEAEALLISLGVPVRIAGPRCC